MKNCMFAALAVAMLGAACSTEPGERSLAPACSEGLAAAERELQNARAAGIGDSVRWAKAASLIAAARIQETFEEYQNCVVKARNARVYINGMRG